MRNMSNQFYKYLSDILKDYFNNNIVKPGERFYFDMDDQKQVEEFYDCLKKENQTEYFSYSYMNGGIYETFFLKYRNIEIVVASTVDVTDGYLVTIRNASNLQDGNWKGKALLILCENGNDSIKSGCRDLKNEGMPFNIKNIAKNLDKNIDSSNLQDVHKEIIKFYVKQKFEDTYISSIWDYSDILAIIKKGTIDKSDYKEFELFEDKSLHKYSGKALENRLSDNHEKYILVERYQDYDDKKEHLEKYFGEKGASALSKDNWYNLEYKKVHDFFETQNILHQISIKPS